MKLKNTGHGNLVKRCTGILLVDIVGSMGLVYLYLLQQFAIEINKNSTHTIRHEQGMSICLKNTNLASLDLEPHSEPTTSGTGGKQISKP